MIKIPLSNLIQEIDVYVDGASRGNPGHSGVGVVIVDNQGNQLDSELKCIGEKTNNEAEYAAVIQEMHLARKYCRWKVNIYSDSEHVIEQINISKRISKDNMERLCLEVYRLKDLFKDISFHHIPRENQRMKHADMLASQAIERKLFQPIKKLSN